jgi:hypothetical protein
MPRFLILILSTLLATAAFADDDAAFRFGDDVFIAGQTLQHSTVGTDDVFAAGQRVRVSESVTGSVHVIGQNLSLLGDIGGDLYAMGQEVTVEGAIAGDASLAGQDIVINASIGEDLRTVGASVVISAPVAGYAIIAGEKVRINGAISGDVALTAETVIFGDEARIDGSLTVYEDETGELEIPATVISEDRITRLEVSEWEDESFPVGVPSFREMVRRFLGGVVAVTLLAALAAALIPEQLADMRRRSLEAPFRTLGIGFLALSAVVGSVFVVAITLVGLILVPAILLLAVVGVLFGYVVGAYAFGVGLLLLIGQDEPESLAERVIAAATGALVAGVVGLVPFLGWLFVVGLSLTGLGAIVLAVKDYRSSKAAA